MGKARKLTRREFLKGAGAAALGLALSNVVPRKMLSQATGCPEYRGIAPTDWDYTDDQYRQMRPFYERWLDEIKDLGADSVEITLNIKRGPNYQVGYNHYHAPRWLPMDADQGTANNIKNYVRLAQSKGFKVILDIPSLLASEEPHPEPFDLDRFYSNLETMALKWAEIAQELGVEGYCPEGELAYADQALGYSSRRRYPNGDYYYTSPKTAPFIRRLVPKVRERYSGKIIIQENPYQFPDIEFDGADYIGLHLHVQSWEPLGMGKRFVPGQTTQAWRRWLRNQLTAAHQAAQRDNCRVMITEASFGTIPTNGYTSPGITVVNEQQQKELCEAFFQEAWGKTEGIFPWEWGSEPKFARSLAVTDRPAEEVVRRYYQGC